MKRVICSLLVVALLLPLTVIASAVSVSDPDVPTIEKAIQAYEEAKGVEVSTYRYYFQMPNGSNGPVATTDVTYEELDEETGEINTVVVCAKGDQAPSWYNEFTEGAGVYYWGSAEAAPASWAGYKAMVEDADQSIYYADMPTKVVVFIWNNGVDGGTAKSQEIYYKAAQTVDVSSEYADPCEWPGMPEGCDNYDNCIFIINPDKVEQNPFSKKMTCGGSWYFYYGNGCYGMYAQESANFVDIEHNCVNPDHYANGNITGTHIGFDKEEPTEPEPTYLRGDYDEDEQITIMDATRAQNILAELADRPSEEFLAGVDADGDGQLTIMDATRIQNFLAELINMDGSSYGSDPGTGTKKVKSISLNYANLSLTVGDKKTLTAIVTPSNAENKKISWSSSDNSVATVDQSGNVTAIKAGTATITATASDGSGVKATCKVTVTAATVKVTSITLSPPSVSMDVGQKKVINATVSPSNATNKNITWSSSDASVATVDQFGNVTAVKAGTATITATATDGSGVKGTCSINVSVNPDAQYIANYNKAVAIIKNNHSGSIFRSYNNGNEYFSITASSSGSLSFYYTQKQNVSGIITTTTVSCTANFNDSFMIKPNCSYKMKDDLLGINKGFSGSASIDARNYSKNSTLSFSGTTINENKSANTFTQLAFSSWNILLYLECNLNLKDIGFKSYS